MSLYCDRINLFLGYLYSLNFETVYDIVQLLSLK